MKAFVFSGQGAQRLNGKELYENLKRQEKYLTLWKSNTRNKKTVF